MLAFVIGLSLGSIAGAFAALYTLTDPKRDAYIEMKNGYADDGSFVRHVPLSREPHILRVARWNPGA
jgi:hypothetical protein